MFKKLLEHNITNCDEQFFCHLCMSEQSNLEDALHHINEEKHQLLWSDQTVNILKDCEEQTCQILRDNKIAIVALSSFNCISCCCSFQDLISTLKHVQNKCHIDQLKNKHVALNCDEDNSEICIVSVKSKLSKVRKKKLDLSDKSMLLKDTFTYKDERYDSSQGHSKYMPFEFFKIVYNYSDEDCQTLVNNRILKFEYYQLICQCCYRCCLTSSDILQHIMAAKHTETDTTLNEKESKQIQPIPVNSEVIKNVVESDLHEVKQNYESKTVKCVKTVNCISVRTQQEQNINDSKDLSSNDIICELCKCHLPSPDHILPHIKGRRHVSLLATVNQLPQSTEENDNDNTKLDLINNKDQSINNKVNQLPQSTEENDNDNTKLDLIENRTQQEQNINDSEDLSSNDIICEVCKCHLPSPDHILPHIKGRRHVSLLATVNQLPQSTEENDNDNTKLDLINNKDQSINNKVDQLPQSTEENGNDTTKSDLIENRTQQEQNINDSEDLSSNDIICELCKCYLPSPDHISPHIKGRRHVSLLAKVNQLPQSTEEKDNDNTKLDLIENKYTSQITVMDIPSKKSKTKDHQSNLKLNIDCKICTAACTKDCLKKYDEIFLNNNITIEGSKFICALCDRICNSLHNTLQHINGKIHTNNLKCQDQNSDICGTIYTMCTNSDNDGSANQKPIVNISKNKMNVSVNEKWNLNNTAKQEDLINIEEKDRTNEIQDNSNNTNALDKSLYFCELCSIQIDITNLHEHINTAIHKCNIPTMSIGDDIFLFKCFCCKSIIQGTISLINHLNSTKHLNNFKNTLICIKTNNSKIFPQSPDTQNILEATESALCSVFFSKIGNVPMYLSEKCLISFDTSNIIVCDDIKNKIIYSCLICRVTLNTAHNLIEHCRARMHLWRIKQTSRETLNYSSETLNCPSNKMEKEQINTTTDNCFGITSDINAQITKLLHVSPFIHNSKFTKKHDHKGQKIVKRLNKVYCEKYLEIEERMFTLDEKKLNNMKLSFKPFMPFNTKSFYCLACKDIVSKELDLLYEHVCLDTHKSKLYTITEDANSEKLIKQYMQQISKNLIRCNICRSYIKNDTKRIDAHINNKMHKKKCETFCADIDSALNSITQNLTNLWYSIQRFSCVPCKKSFNYKMEFIEHIAGEKHKIYSTKEIFDFCIPCATLWLDTKDCYTEHCNDVVHKYLIKSKDFIVEDLPECIKKLLEQVDKISDVLFEQTQILMNDAIQKEVTESLENTLKSLYPSIKAFLFGSRITGLGTVNSDIDIYLDCENTYNQDLEECLRKKYFKSIEKILRQEKEWVVKEVIESRTPIIKLLYKPTNTQCDISITNGLSVENSKLIRSFNDAYPPCRKLILFIKKWLSCINLPPRHGLTNYAIVWIVIFYLQLNLHLPSVATLIKEENKSRLICGWETGVAQPKNNNNSVQSLSMLLLGFFQFYANFDYQHYIICPLMGCTLVKRDFIKLDMLPEEMEPYINHINESKDPEYFRIDSPLCVQDPFDLSHNLTKAVSNITLKYFKQYCQDSASILSSKNEAI